MGEDSLTVVLEVEREGETGEGLGLRSPVGMVHSGFSCYILDLYGVLIPVMLYITTAVGVRRACFEGRQR